MLWRRSSSLDYLLLSLLYLPILSEMAMEGRVALGEVSRRSRPWLYTSIFIFSLLASTS